MAKKGDLEMPDVSGIKAELSEVDADFDAQFKALEEKRREARDKKVQSLKDQRGKLAQQRNEVDVAIRNLDKLLQDLTGRAPRSPGGGGKRRSGEEMKADADKIVAFLRKHPESKASAIKDATGVNWGLSLKEFVKKNAGETLKTTGAKASMVYSVS